MRVLDSNPTRKTLKANKIINSIVPIYHLGYEGFSAPQFSAPPHRMNIGAKDTAERIAQVTPRLAARAE